MKRLTILCLILTLCLWMASPRIGEVAFFFAALAILITWMILDAFRDHRPSKH